MQALVVNKNYQTSLGSFLKPYSDGAQQLSLLLLPQLLFFIIKKWIDDEVFAD